LNDARIGDPQLRGHAGWRDVSSLGLPDALSVEWDSFISLLCENFITLDDESEDSLCWSKNPKDGSFMTKLGYKSWQEDRLEISLKWWWKPMWKFKSPLKCKITLWLALNNKLLDLG
jgi:hypothetical protein